MPYQIDFDSRNRILRACFQGRVTDDDLKEGYRFGQENVKRFDPLSGITDFSGVTTVAFSAQTMLELARTKPIMPDPSRLVVFVAPSPDLFGMAQMFQLQGAEARPNLHVVRTTEEAYQVLWVRNPQFVSVTPEE